MSNIKKLNSKLGEEVILIGKTSYFIGVLYMVERDFRYEVKNSPNWIMFYEKDIETVSEDTGDLIIRLK